MHLAAVDIEALRQGALLMILLVVAISLHEFGHAWMADRRGDLLPRAQGRVTIDPSAHVDPIGTLLIPAIMIFWPAFAGGGAPIALIGWGKPVQVSLSNPRTRKADDILITLAGPAMNLLLCLGFALVLRATGPAGLSESADKFLMTGLELNACLMAFNLLPIPPLDGGRILRWVVGMSEETFRTVATYAPWVLLILINTRFFVLLLDNLMGLVMIPCLWLAGRG